MKRGEGDCCGTCACYVRSQGGVGECHYDPPGNLGFPIVRASDWCSQYEADDKSGLTDLTEQKS